MRTSNGITATASYYTITAVAVKDGKAVSTVLTADHRDAKAAKQAAAEKLGVPASRVAVEFELKRHSLVIDCDYFELYDLLSNAGVGFEEK